MPLTEDLERISELVLKTDPAFRRVETAVIETCLRDAHRCATQGSLEDFLLSAMRLLARAGNGHTRLIPNDAISVLPLRFVSIGPHVHLVSAPAQTGISGGKLISVNGAPVRAIEAAASGCLAGTPQRQRVIGAILLAWPHALAALGFSGQEGRTEYLLEHADGQRTALGLSNDGTVPASELYPRNEHGRPDPDWVPETFVGMNDWEDLGRVIALPSFFDLSENTLSNAITGAADQVRAAAPAPLLIDVRGNTGGDFLKTMPLIDAICAVAGAGPGVGVLVDKFTFSAAIVFVALLKHRLGARLRILGEEMGDDLTFFAEGGLIELPGCGASVRYSSAFHDWKTGTTDATTPPEIARHVIAAGSVAPDVAWIAPLADAGSQGAFHRRVLESLQA